VPAGKYVNLSVRREVREELDKLREEVKINDLNDLLILLVRTYREHTNTISKFEELLTNAVSKAVRETLQPLTNTISKASTDRTNSISKSPGGKKTAIEILRETKVRCISDMRSAKNPEAVIERMKTGGAVVVRTDEDVCAVDPDFWDLFKKRLEEVKTADDREVLSRLGDEKMKKLFQLLRKPGALYLDNKKRWVFDYSFIEEPGEKKEGEEEVPVDWEIT
jgi:hypothetical protein